MNVNELIYEHELFPGQSIRVPEPIVSDARSGKSCRNSVRNSLEINETDGNRSDSIRQNLDRNPVVRNSTESIGSDGSSLTWVAALYVARILLTFQYQ